MILGLCYYLLLGLPYGLWMYWRSNSLKNRKMAHDLAPFLDYEQLRFQIAMLAIILWAPGIIADMYSLVTTGKLK